MPVWIIELLEVLIPPILQILVNAHMKREQTPEVQGKVQSLQQTINYLKK